MEFGIALGVAILGVVGTTIYRSEVSGTVPAEMPVAAADLTRDTLAGAAAAADGLTDPLGIALLGPAREAFTTGLNVVAVICALTAAVLAYLAAALLRHLRATAGTDDQTHNTCRRSDS